METFPFLFAPLALLLLVPLAPGLVVPVGVEWHRRLEPGGVAELAPGAGVVALAVLS